MPHPKTQTQATRGACCLFLVPSGRCKSLLNQLMWVFRLECYKTAPRWVQPRIPLCIHSASSTAPHQANTNAASSERYTRSSVRTGRCTRHREHPGWAWLGTKQPAWGLRVGEPQENEAGIQVARTRFFSAKPNETGLTKIKKRFFSFFRLHTTQKSRSKSKMSPKPSIFDYQR